MTQLVYHPAFDPYNAALRLLRLLTVATSELDRTTLRILDFYMLFPEELKQARLSTSLRSRVRRLNSASRFPYDRLPAQRPLFSRMEPTFDAALQTLVAKGLVKCTDERAFTVIRDNVPRRLQQIVSERNSTEPELLATLIEMGTSFSSLGPNGLKDRTGLAEYRYDAF